MKLYIISFRVKIKNVIYIKVFIIYRFNDVLYIKITELFNDNRMLKTVVKILYFLLVNLFCYISSINRIIYL
jgi:hypothetical protein